MGSACRVRKTLILVIWAAIAQLTGCATTAPDQTQYQTITAIPQWVKTPPRDNAQFLYGIGEGYSLDKAKQSALKDIAGKLATNVKSETENRTSLNNGHTDSSFSQKINTQVEDIKLTDYELLKSSQQQDRIYVLIAMSRDAFIQDKQDQLNDLNTRIAAELKDINSKNKTLQLVGYNNAISLANQARPLLYLLRTTDPLFDGQSNLDTYRQYERKEKQLSASTAFYVTSDPSMTALTQQVKTALQTNGFQLSSQAGTDGIIEIKGSINEAEIFSTKSVKINLNILVKTAAGQLISSKSYLLSGSSVDSYETAQRNAVNTLTRQISDKAGIYLMLGLASESPAG